jgi:hypothetical protein
MSEDPSLNESQVLLAHVIFDKLIELKIWSEALNEFDFLQMGSDSFAVSRYKLEAEVSTIFKQAIGSGTVSPINQVELLAMRTSHSYFDYLSGADALPLIERSPEFAWAHLETHKLKIRKDVYEDERLEKLMYRRVALVNELAGPMHALVLADFLASPQTSSFGWMQNLKIRANYAFPEALRDQERKKFILDAIRNGAEPQL